MTVRSRSDRGQAFPIYVVMVAGLLFLVFAFFAVGKASALRNGSQGAADSAALAAAQAARADFESGFIASLPENMLDAFLAAPFTAPCGEAQSFASDNDADVTSCTARYGPRRDSIKVEVEGREAVDSSVIPGTKRTFAKAKATAIIEFRCTWQALDFDNNNVQDLFIFSCGDAGMVEIVPSSPPPWSQVSKILFDVHLVDN
ncbi:pilus assembly protein TadG-related protein [Streptomyces sp. NBC_00654]|uniref:pilus assembly protein TadG-related protein n=1 Tax=Streptomyces sp. NBC_00654 TaxID=2975799 RepID=UPI002253C677|nr:pilus assembly protein TadG-related protein [Streptomyces sp. NBC_00654]MCX4964502.1 pilus assembly protein TadG-related protein [Streptomyces sp. NBC_00654]